MSTRWVVLAVAVMAACGKSPTANDLFGTHEEVVKNGALTLTLTDAPTPMGILFTRPTATGGAGSLSVTSTRYGSLCLFAVSGHVDISSNTIVLHIGYEQRLTTCTSEARKLTYQALLGGLPAGTFTLRVLHEESRQIDEVISAQIVVTQGAR